MIVDRAIVDPLSGQRPAPERPVAAGEGGESSARAGCFESDMVRPASSRRAGPRLARVLLAAALLVPLFGAAPAGAVESLDYRWSLRGFLGRLAGVVVPNETNLATART